MRPEHWLFTIPLRLRSLFRWAQADQELDDELRDHLERKTEEYVVQGMTQEEAHRRARLDLEGIEQTKEKCRDARRVNWIQNLIQDLRFGFRMWRKSPSFTAVAILTLALGIGANTAIFTLLHVSLWTPLAVNDPKEIFHVMRASSEGDFAGEFSYSYPLFQQFAKTASAWGEVFATEVVGARKFGLNGVSDQRVAGEAVSGNFFSVLNVGPIVGRVLEPQDDNVLGGNHVAVLSYTFWKSRFQSDASVLGRTIFYDETPYTVVGIARPGFTGIEPEVSVDMWVPATAAGADRGWRPDPNLNWLRLLVRLHDGVDPGRAQAMFEAAFRAHVADALLPTASPRFKQMLAAQHITVRPAASGLATTGRKYEKPLLVLFGVAAVVLLISCANIANLILARNAARHREIVVRLALGASRTRIAWQLFTENLTLALSGCLVAVLLSAWGTRLLVSLLPPSSLPVAFNLRPDFAVFGFTGGVAVATAILFGLGPALRASREKLEMSLHGGQRVIGSGWRGRLLVAGQLALSLPLLVGAGLFVKTLHNLKSSDLGFHAENVVTFDLSHPKGTSQDRLRQACAEIKQRLESHPGVIVASYSSGSMYGDGGWSGSVDVIGNPSPGKDNDVGLISAGPGFFEAIGLGLLQGRYLNFQDQAEKPPVAVVNESFARHYFGSESAIGQRIKLDFEPEIVREIVGLVRDAKHYGVRERVWPMVYLPAREGDSFLVRANLNTQLLAGIVRTEVRASDKILQIQEMQPFDTVINGMISQERLTALLSSVFGVLACLIAAIGLYGVVAYGVSRRTNEFGIRMAMGAQRRDVRILVLRQTLVVILCGVAIGVGGALVAARLLSSEIYGMLYGIKPTDISLLMGATISLVAIALLAAFLPARRASRVDPMVALRYE